MSNFRLILSSLSYYKGIHLSVLLGVALTSAILSGALVVGDSVKESLRQNAAARISKVGPALVGGERFLTAKLADTVSEQLGQATIAPILQIEGTVSERSGGKRVNQVQIIGVDDRFWSLSESGKAPDNIEGERWMAVNQPLADRLQAKNGDTLIIRVELPGALSKDAPLSGESEQTTPFTAKIDSIIGANDFGRYSLKAEQVPAATIFLPLQRLQQILEQPESANVFLGGNDISESDFQNAFRESWEMPDIALGMTPVPNSNIQQLLSGRVFLDEALVTAVKEVTSPIAPVLTYLANEIRLGENITPYSMIAGVGPELNQIVDGDLQDNEIILSDWMAEDLGAKVGDELVVAYNVVETGRKLIEQKSSFTVKAIKPLGSAGWDQSWTPNFPGIFDVEDLDDWEPGIPIDRDKIRQKDEDFWDNYKATPKAFITLNAARKIWSNRFGNTTSVRLKEAAGPDEFADLLREKLNLSDLGISFRNLAAEAEAAVAKSFDFGQLFAYMSFFLIISALVLCGLIFVFGIEQRSSQIGLFLALGFTRKKIRKLFLSEAVIVSLIGAGLGLLLGVIYTRLALAGMSSAWKDAAAGIEFVYFVRWISLVIAFVLTVFFALFAVWLASRRVMKFQPRELITGSLDSETETLQVKTWWKQKAFIGFLLSLLAGLGCLLAPKAPGTMAEQGLFFGGGFLFTIAGVFLSSILIGKFAKPSATLQSLSALGRQHTVRRRGRSLAVIGLMAAGVFMVTAINSFRLEGERGANRRDSGTGGFAYVGDATLPVYEDLNSDEGRKKYGLGSVLEDPESAHVLSFRVSEGDDASCLNLNRAQRPRLMAVDAKSMEKVNPFSFAKTDIEVKNSPWETLSEAETETDEGIPIIPGVVDQNTATYALQLGIGDLIDYETGSGEPFSVRIAGFLGTSILQGSVVISEENFIRFFPDAGGYRYFLLDSKEPETADKMAQHLTRMFGDRGLEMQPAAERLNEFNAVQNTYLSIFSTLGGFGVLLGTLGLGIIVVRNVLERRGELGVMQAVGFTRKSLADMVLSEHWFLHVTGVLLGVVAAAIAVLPKLQSGGAQLPLTLLVGINAAVLVGGIVFCWLAARIVMRGNLLEGLRRE